MSRFSLLLAFSPLPVSAQQPVQIPTEADAKQAYYNCLYAYISDKTDWDATPSQLVEAAESTCDYEYDQLALAILKSRQEIYKLSDQPWSMAKEAREDIVEQARNDMKRVIFEARHRPKPK